REVGIEHTQSGAAPEVTVSIGGITVTGRQGSAEELLVAADRQLYAAKQQGRNRIRWADLTSG
ncbi:MAG: diguanylate cyclase, partial [Betaproteobacteria bacterium]|nr:diguanylate cyclase [Betaproteobacteria bacterium]